MRKHQVSFKARDEVGELFLVHQYVDIIFSGTLSDPNAVEFGLKSLETSDGKAVNFVSKGKYEIVQSGKILTAMDENPL